VQSVAQLADRYPRTEWEELVGCCDTQQFLGGNDVMTSEFISKQCGDMTVRVNDATIPMQPLFSPVISSNRPYTHAKKSTGRPLMMPDEVRRLPKNESIVLVRGEKPLKLLKIQPEEHPDNGKLTNVRVNDYLPEWRKTEAAAPKPTPLVFGKGGQLTMDFPPAPKLPEQETLYPGDDETDLNPVKSLDLGRGIDCSAVEETQPGEM
jgi:type IV secretion system protein VirD4